MADDDVTCAHCGEVQSKDYLRCPRCGASIETKEKRTRRLAAEERSRREAERNDVSIQRLPGFGTNGTLGAAIGTKRYWAEMSNQRRRLFLVVVLVYSIGVAFFWSR
jgi:DNA-directed RNA polymerase subunit RPC12/RpoP